ncbi:hypothetical protein Tsubulata_004365 [Turnera subulata]|uniref:Uncharacterized protein n=1 Tax=Turnera subulata TaxID=218843 RepID=A0A9Q0G849_9ROSI|nr:hypothetical protein Tsubulata_004365 [Turnera subulata]
MEVVSSPSKRTICFALQQSGDWGRFEWYTFDLSSEDPIITNCSSSNYVHVHAYSDEIEEEFESLTPKAYLYNDEARLPGWAVVGGHQLYALGGSGKSCKRYSNSVRRNDLLVSPRLCDPQTLGVPDKGWCRLPRMLSRREEPQSAVVGDKIYVFGGAMGRYYKPSNRHPWSEVYDPKYNTWMPLPPPPFLPTRDFLLASWEGEETTHAYIAILSIHDRVSLLYDVDDRRWTQSEFPYHVDFAHGSAVVAGGLFYWFSPSEGNLHAYDLDSKVLYTSSPVDPTFVNGLLRDEADPMLGHLGGDTFCLLYSLYSKVDPSTRTERRFLHCLKFNVTFDPNPTRRRIKISLGFCQSYLVKHGFLCKGVLL